MGLNVTNLTDFVNENKMELIKKSILEGRTMDYVVIQPDIKSSAAINIIDSTIQAQAGGCSFNDLGSTELKQRNISVDAVRVNESICLDELEAKWTQSLMNKGSYNETIPFEEIYVQDKAEKIANMIETMVWQGDKDTGVGNLAYTNGFLKVIDAEVALGNVIEGNVEGETSITVANIISIVDGMVDSVPEAIINADDLYLFISYADFRTYARALRNANLFHYDGQEGKDFIMTIPGTNVTMVATSGLNATSRMVLSRKANLYVGTDLLNDYEDFDIFYSKDNQEVRFISKFKIGTQLSFPDFIVEYTNA